MSAAATRPRDAIAEVLGKATSDEAWWGVLLGVAAFAHAAVASALPRRTPLPPPPRPPLELVDLDLRPVSPASPLPEPHPTPSTETPPPRVSFKAPLAAPRAAQAPPVLTRPTIPSDVIDLTDTESFVTESGSPSGSGAAGAVATASSGGNAIGGARRPTPSPAPLQPPPDHSRRPALAGGTDWACPFPSEAELAHVPTALVAIRVDVDASGAVRNVSIQSDAGNGFGRAAERCARTKRWTPALDRGGHPVDGTVVIHVRFVRE